MTDDWTYSSIARDIPKVLGPDEITPGLLKFKNVDDGDTAVAFGLEVDGTQYALDTGAFTALVSGLMSCLFESMPDDPDVMEELLAKTTAMVRECAENAHDPADPGWSI